MAESALACGNTRRLLNFSPYWSRTAFPNRRKKYRPGGYIDGMEEKLSQMMDEMKAMRLEVEKLHDKGIRARCAQLVGTAEGKSARERPCFPRPGQTLSRLPGVCWGRFRKRGARPAPCGAGAAYPRRPLPHGARFFPRKPGDGAMRRETGCDPG